MQNNYTTDDNKGEVNMLIHMNSDISGVFSPSPCGLLLSGNLSDVKLTKGWAGCFIDKREL